MKVYELKKDGYGYEPMHYSYGMFSSYERAFAKYQEVIQKEGCDSEREYFEIWGYGVDGEKSEGELFSTYDEDEDCCW